MSKQLKPGTVCGGGDWVEEIKLCGCLPSDMCCCEELPGTHEGDACNREGCEGVIEDLFSDRSCSCHLVSPCPKCVEDGGYCPKCGCGGSSGSGCARNAYSEIWSP